MKRIWAIFFALMLLLFGVATSHAALYFPHVDTTAGQWQTEICVINPSTTETVQGTLTRYRDDGTQAASMPLSVGPNARVQVDVGAGLASASNTGYVVFQNTSGSPVGYTKFTQIGGDRVAVPAVATVSTGNLYVTHIDWVTWWTGISLVNTTTETKTLTIRFNDNQTKQVILGPKEHTAFTIKQLFNSLIDTDIESAVIENASGVVGLELFGNEPGFGTQLGGVPLTSRTTTTLFYPHVESAGGWWTGIVAYNPSTAATAQVTVNAYNAGGTLLGSSSPSLGPGVKFIGLSTDPQLNLPAGTAWFNLQSPIPLVGFELFGTAPVRLAGYSVVDLEGRAGIFPKVEKNGWTGIAFVNTEDQQATVTLKAYDDAGATIATGTKVLTAHQKWVGYPVDQNANVSLFAPGTNLNAATYISFSADRNVAGFQLNGSGNMMLDALPALPAQASSGPQGAIDRVLDLFKYQSTVDSGMQALSTVLSQILSGGGGTCPDVKVVPPLEGLENPPPAITITANFGTTGCTIPADGSTVSGQVVLAITNLTAVEPNIALDYSLTATNLTRDGELLLNGAVSGHIGITISGSTISQLDVSVNFANLQVAGRTITGSMAITGTNFSLSGLTGNITVSFNNLTAAGYTVTSGTVTFSSPGGLTAQLAANLNTSQGPVIITVEADRPTDTRTVFRTPTPGTIAGYTVTLNNVVVDTEVCDGYPSGGSVTASQGGETATETFTPSCPALQMMDQVAPTRERKQWLDFSVDLYKYLTVKR